MRVTLQSIAVVGAVVVAIVSVALSYQSRTFAPVVAEVSESVGGLSDKDIEPTQSVVEPEPEKDVFDLAMEAYQEARVKTGVFGLVAQLSPSFGTDLVEDYARREQMTGLTLQLAILEQEAAKEELGDALPALRSKLELELAKLDRDRKKASLEDLQSRQKSIGPSVFRRILSDVQAEYQEAEAVFQAVVKDSPENK